MSFLNYLLLGTLSYAAGWAVRIYVLEKQKPVDQEYGLKHPKVVKFLLGFFVLMLIVSALIGHFALGHEHFDYAFIIVNSMVATFVFSFSLSPDTVRHDLPD